MYFPSLVLQWAQLLGTGSGNSLLPWAPQMPLSTEGRRQGQEGRREGWGGFSSVKSLWVPGLCWLWWKELWLGDLALFPALIMASPQRTHFLVTPAVVFARLSRSLCSHWQQDRAHAAESVSVVICLCQRKLSLSPCYFSLPSGGSCWYKWLLSGGVDERIALGPYSLSAEARVQGLVRARQAPHSWAAVPVQSIALQIWASTGECGH